MKKLAARLAISLFTSVVVIVLIEGSYSLTANRSLRRVLSRGRDLGVDLSLLTEIQEEAVERTTKLGSYRTHEDPNVGYAYRPSANLSLRGRSFQTDRLGLRRRMTPLPAGPRFNIVVLGDSVAFGQGLGDEDTLACQLEAVLADCAGPRGETIVCRNVATPSWNHRGAIRFLIDHAAELKPDHVLHILVGNDLADAYSAGEDGHRFFGLDRERMTFVHSSMAYTVFLDQRLQEAGERVAYDELGPTLLTEGINPESRRRLHRMARDTVHLRDRLATMGAGLNVAFFHRSSMAFQLHDELNRLGETVQFSPLFEVMTPEDNLGYDAHPNGETVRAMAVWFAQDLLDQGVVRWRGAPRTLAPPARLQGRRAAPLDADRARRGRAENEARTRRQLRPRVSNRTGEGARQVLTGMNPDCSMGPTLIAVVAPGPVLEVALSPLENTPHLLPLTVQVSIQNQVVGKLTLTRRTGPEPVVARFDVPAEWQDQPLEVMLRARDWVVAPMLGKFQRLASCRPQWIATDL